MGVATRFSISKYLCANPNCSSMSRLPLGLPRYGLVTSAIMTTGNSRPFEECIVMTFTLSPPPLSATGRL